MRHNIYDIASKDVLSEEWWRDKESHKTMLRSRWDCKFESIDGWCSTIIIWKYCAYFLTATTNKEHG